MRGTIFFFSATLAVCSAAEGVSDPQIVLTYLVNNLRAQPHIVAEAFSGMSERFFDARIFNRTIETKKGLTGARELCTYLEQKEPGLALLVEPAASRLAQAHAERMVVKQKLTHYHTAQGLTPARALSQYGTVKGRSSQIVFKADLRIKSLFAAFLLLLADEASPRERTETLLDPIFSRLGVGLAEGKNYAFVCVIVLEGFRPSILANPSFKKSALKETSLITVQTNSSSQDNSAVIFERKGNDDSKADIHPSTSSSSDSRLSMRSHPSTLSPSSGQQEVSSVVHYQILAYDAERLQLIKSKINIELYQRAGSLPFEDRSFQESTIGKKAEQLELDKGVNPEEGLPKSDTEILNQEKKEGVKVQSTNNQRKSDATETLPLSKNRILPESLKKAVKESFSLKTTFEPVFLSKENDNFSKKQPFAKIVQKKKKKNLKTKKSKKNYIPDSSQQKNFIKGPLIKKTIKTENNQKNFGVLKNSIRNLDSLITSSNSPSEIEKTAFEERKNSLPQTVGLSGHIISEENPSKFSFLINLATKKVYKYLSMLKN